MLERKDGSPAGIFCGREEWNQGYQVMSNNFPQGRNQNFW
jgi:hypothetical protein